MAIEEKQGMRVYTTRFYTASCLAVALGLGAAAFLVHAKTGGNALLFSAGQPLGASVESWASKQKRLKADQRKMTPEEMREIMNTWEKRQYEQSAAQRWRDYQYQLKTFDKTKQEQIAAMAKANPDKAAAMANDYQKLRATITEYQEHELLRPWPLTATAPVVTPGQP